MDLDQLTATFQRIDQHIRDGNGPYATAFNVTRKITLYTLAWLGLAFIVLMLIVL